MMVVCLAGAGAGYVGACKMGGRHSIFAPRASFIYIYVSQAGCLAPKTRRARLDWTGLDWTGLERRDWTGPKP